MSSNLWPLFNTWYQLIILMVIISKKSSMGQTDTSETKFSTTKNFNNDLSNAKPKIHSRLGELKIWSMLLPQLWYSDNYDDNNNKDVYLLENQKRSWHSLQGSWGKRSPRNYIKTYDTNNFVEKDVNSDNNNNASQLNYLKNTNILNSNSDQVSNDEYNTGVLGMADWNDNVMAEKRAWNKLRQLWGKRNKKNSSWNNIHNAWGKRETNNWNNLKGLWGKRNDENTGKWLQPANDWREFKKSSPNALQVN